MNSFKDILQEVCQGASHYFLKLRFVFLSEKPDELTHCRMNKRYST